MPELFLVGGMESMPEKRCRTLMSLWGNYQKNINICPKAIPITCLVMCISVDIDGFIDIF